MDMHGWDVCLCSDISLLYFLSYVYESVNTYALQYYIDSNFMF